MIDTRETEVRTLGFCLRSNLNRTVQRGSDRDHKTAVRWMARAMLRGGYSPVADSVVNYIPDWFGPLGKWFVKQRCLVPTDDFERNLFRGVRLPENLHWFRYAVPAETTSPME